MTPPESPLRRLDERWVPRAAAAVQRAVHRMRGPAGRPVGLLLRHAVSDEPALAGSIAAVLVAGLLLGIVGEPGPRDNSQSQAFSPGRTAIVATVGPVPGTAVASYLTKASFDMRHFGEVGHGGATYAVVDLDSYSRPAQVESMFRNVDVVRVYVKVRAGQLPTLVRSVPVADIAGLETGMRTAGIVARTTAKSYGVLLSGLHPKTPADRTVKDRYAEQRRAALREATALGHPAQCRCVFAVILRGTFVQLAAVAGTPGVRAVDPAPPQVELTGLTALPLLPEVRHTVPRTGLPGG